jgi:hypothetical protein
MTTRGGSCIPQHGRVRISIPHSPERPVPNRAFAFPGVLRKDQKEVGTVHSSKVVYRDQSGRWRSEWDVLSGMLENPIRDAIVSIGLPLRVWRQIVNACDYSHDPEIVARVTVMGQIGYFWSGKPDGVKVVRMFERTAANIHVMALRAGVDLAHGELPDHGLLPELEAQTGQDQWATEGGEADA